MTTNEERKGKNEIFYVKHVLEETSKQLRRMNHRGGDVIVTFNIILLSKFQSCSLSIKQKQIRINFSSLVVRLACLNDDDSIYEI